MSEIPVHLRPRRLSDSDQPDGCKEGPFINERAGALARRTAEIKQQAFDEKDTAKKQLGRHKLTCLVCNPKLRFIRPAK